MLLQVPERVWGAIAVHDTVRAVFRDPAFQRSLQRSLADSMFRWLGDLVARLSRALRHAPAARTIALCAVGLIVLLIAARLIVLSRADRDAEGRTARRGGVTGSEDPWRMAELLFDAGRFEQAAHALYRGVLVGLAHDQRVRLDPSKTSGDYARELHRRESPAVAPFRAFVGRFDVAVYGHGGCDAASVTDLRALSAPFRAKVRAA